MDQQAMSKVSVGFLMFLLIYWEKHQMKKHQLLHSLERFCTEVFYCEKVLREAICWRKFGASSSNMKATKSLETNQGKLTDGFWYDQRVFPNWNTEQLFWYGKQLMKLYVCRYYIFLYCILFDYIYQISFRYLYIKLYQYGSNMFKSGIFSHIYHI